MNILVINYEMDDSSPVLAWQAAIARELSRYCSRLLVFTERRGQFASAPNMTVHQIGHIPQLFDAARGFRGISQTDVFRLCHKMRIDACFIHMAHKWAFRFYPVFMFLRIPTLLWYAHGTVTCHLRRAHECASRVVTSTPEGFRLQSDKVHYIGQGINTDLFTIPEFDTPRNDIVYTGRITRRKRIGLMLRTMAVLRRLKPDVPFRLLLVGPILTGDDSSHMEELLKLHAELGLGDSVKFLGSLPQQRHPELYRGAFLHFNVSATGSMDKTVLEAMACGCPVLTSNIAFKQLLIDQPESFIESETPETLAERILFFHATVENRPAAQIRDLVVGKHDQISYARKIYSHLREIHEKSSSGN